MSWSSTNPDEPKTSYASKTTNIAEIREDIKIVVDKMIENREADNAGEAKQLLFFINATNGYIQISWCDFANDKVLGDWVYWLELKDFWKATDNSSVFDEKCFRAIAHFTEYYMFDEDFKVIYEVFYRTELSRARSIGV